MEPTLKNSITFRNALTLGVSLGALAIAPTGVGFAQEDATSTSRLETITVTAQKREQTLQDAPVAVSVATAATIENSASQDLYDLQSIIPSLRINQLQSSQNTNFTIRGFGNGANNAGLEPSVGVFIDGVYRSRTASQIADLPKVDRVEVLRGPQSTLFGKNASAGVISIVTSKPEFEYGGSVSASLGNYNSMVLRANITDGIVEDKLAGSISGYVNKRDGYFEDPITGSTNNVRDRSGIRGQLLFTALENAEFRLIADYDTLNEACCGVVNLTAGPTVPVIYALGDTTPGANDAIVAEAPFSYQFTQNYAPSNSVTNKGISLHGDIDLGFAELTTITANRTTKANDNYDIDFSRADVAQDFLTSRSYNTFTQELRLNGSGERYDWTAGVFYFDENVTQNLNFEYGSAFRGYADTLAGGGVTNVETALRVAPGTYFAAGQGVTEAATQGNQATSVFGQFDYDLSEKLTLTLGLSYTKDNKDVTIDVNANDPFSALVLDGADGLAVLTAGGVAARFEGTFGLPFSPANVGAVIASQGQAVYDGYVAAVSAGVAALDLTDATDNPLLGLQALQFTPQFLDFPNVVENGKTSEDALTYTARAAYEVNDNFNVYASYATGFKAPSWNLSRDSRPFASSQSLIELAGLQQPNQSYGTRFAGKEEAKVLELGLKASFDNVAFNVTVFDQTIDGFQSNLFNGTGFSLANAEEQRTKGLELDGTWSPFEGLTLNGALTMLDPTYEGDFFVVLGDGTAVNLKGQKPAGIHEQSLSLSGIYNFGLTENWGGMVRAEYNYESEVEIQDNIPGFTRDQNLLNAAIGIENLSSGLKAQLWVRNALQDEYIQTVFPGVAQAGTVSGYPNVPRMYGITVKKDF